MNAPDPSTVVLPDSAAQHGGDDPPSQRFWTVPNVLCLIRLSGAPWLLLLAWLDRPFAFLGWYVFLAITDWIDGKLAILLNERSVYGARLDSWADATMYGSLLAGGLWLRWDLLYGEIAWIVPPVACYAASTAVGFWKFGRWPSYHTRAAKTSWLLVLVGAASLIGGWSLWPLRLASVAVTLTNVEAILISCLLRSWHADIPSLYHAWRLREGGG